MSKKMPGTIIIVSAVVLMVMGSLYFYQQATTPTPAQRPFLCLTPYSLEYCHAHQYQMYRENAQRALED